MRSALGTWAVAGPLLALLMLAGGASGARVLALFIIPGRSHFIVTSSLARALAERGHELTVVSPFTTDNPPPTYKDLKVPSTIDLMGKTDFFSLGNMPPATMLLFMWGMGIESCKVILAQPQMQELMKTQQKYDLVLLEAFFSDCLLGYAHTFKAPIVQVSAFGGAPWMGDWVGNPSTPSYVPDPFLDFSDHMSFTQRLTNAALGVVENVGRSFYYLPRVDAVMQQAFNDPTMPPLADLERNTSVLLVNSHFSLTYPRPAVPAYVQVGGFHIQKPKRLPDELRAWMEATPQGFVYFSMGSNLRSADMPAEKRQAFLSAFAALAPLRVLWKWEEETLPGQPPNVRLEKWLPQPDVLAHPKCRLFITHGGLMSTQEAAYHGVPLVGIPIFGDQQLNMARAAAAGFGVALRFQDVTKETLSTALQQVLVDDSYRTAAKRLSSIFHDRPRAPMDEAIFWIEYVIRHKGARHLRSAAVDMPLYQYLLLDVVAALAVVFIVVGLVTFRFMRAILRWLCRSKTSKVTNAQKVAKKRN